MEVIIQKFGGTSVASKEARGKVIEKIEKALRNDEIPIVVVSAMGRIGAPYATDTLLKFVEENAGEMKDREYDLLLSCGEIISCVTMATLLNQKGIRAQALTGGQSGIITDDKFKQAELLYTDPTYLLKCVEEGIVPVVAGFQGMTQNGQITTIGRGGSDTTASMLGVAVNAKRIEIYTDVDGIMTADPRVCDEAHIIPAISYSEVFQLADSGAKVIHPRAVEYAMRSNIPLVIKNTFSDAVGTFIVQDIRSIYTKKDEFKVITGIAHRSGRVQYTIEDTILNEYNLLEAVATANISIDLINIFPDYKVFTIDTSAQDKMETLLKNGNYVYTKITGCAKITAIGERMTGVPGVMARIIKAMIKNNINILQTADSLTTIACLVPEDQISTAIGELHKEFNI
ncbi:aspartate kinase [Candidatus Epulonipiscium fishelsonii]|uniref:Aspartate kinase n=1 Tax=Candidatus Epulonipiscium fishelsonii TaxID=77094 RepID=A0ACC8XGT6_9FIRM|nr:aspartate kinase [Epulopiscium sp. SCG-B05WGA-EpuloA1]ONI42886.1 aspartate kinase [Epulopiscium sp. SCG-B11WGA-EpuloA1]